MILKACEGNSNITFDNVLLPHTKGKSAEAFVAIARLVGSLLTTGQNLLL